MLFHPIPPPGKQAITIAEFHIGEKEMMISIVMNCI